ncbi:hypothetical protein AA106_10075 [Photorhabdus laumondii subsp. laumondii]|nr:hypothetical protein A4R40_04890 [Photorhabdus laumondii subsp. laumondii]KTL61210.1 hypothetical protein AA106_10075 [Photorhabdus laumondii subsp. laumondii]
MANIIYLTLKGKKQGLISAGCGSLNSIGNNYQHGHENEIFIYSLQHLMTREQHVSHHPEKEPLHLLNTFQVPLLVLVLLKDLNM